MSRLAIAVLGFWLGMLVASWIAATINFRTVDRVLGAEARPELLQRLSPVGAEDRRVALRHLASEINRWIFERWALAQLALGVATVAFAWSQGGALRALALAALAIVVLQILAGRPIVDLGRSIDFVPRPLPPDVARRFGALHGFYVLADLAKAVLLAAAVVLAVRRP